ncbi:hypothetical protein GTR04_2208 [Trichophyton interdigitale]|uniref:Uncharacterized protein n=1 Tax=Trichophyton interdigitale TaxID=101480 RepID=A0A9P4YL07_9EURO|nr:hypothetical protein GY631_1886 [Trichophyton interdigitale]KAF3898315.1 hypothetical protein GY632_1837 [Trichophyton interdigitale]KAG8210389.1 hypothetical protein GTR04_2208 [Trichophyton interdigitale]
MPPENVRAKDVALIDANSVVNTYSNLNKRDNQSAAAKCASVTAIILAGGAVLGVITGGIGAVAVAGISYAVCITSQASVPGAIVKGGYSGALRPRPGNNKVQKTPATRKKGSGHKTKVNSQGQRLFGTLEPPPWWRAELFVVLAAFFAVGAAAAAAAAAAAVTSS